MYIASYQPSIEDIHSKEIHKEYELIERNVGFKPCFGFQVCSPEQVFFSSFLASANHPTYFYVFDVDDSDCYKLDSVKWNAFIDYHITNEDNINDQFVEKHYKEVGAFIDSNIDLKYCEYIFDITKAKIKLQLPIVPFLTHKAKDIVGVDEKTNLSAVFMRVLSDEVSNLFDSVINNELFLSMSTEKYEREIELNGKETFQSFLLLPYLFVLNLYENLDHNGTFELEDIPTVRQEFQNNYKKAMQYREELVTDGYIEYKTYEHFDEASEFFKAFVCNTGMDLKFRKTDRNDKCPCGSGLKYKKCHGKFL